MMFLFVEECENSLVCEFSRAFCHNIQYCSFLYRKISLVLTIDKLRTNYFLYESYGAYPKYFLFAPSHTLEVLSTKIVCPESFNAPRSVRQWIMNASTDTECYVASSPV